MQLIFENLYYIIFLIVPKRDRCPFKKRPQSEPIGDFYEKNKGRTKEGRIKRITIILGVLFVIFAILLGILYVI